MSIRLNDKQNMFIINVCSSIDSFFIYSKGYLELLRASIISLLNPIQKRFCLSRFLTNHLEQEYIVILEPCHSLGLQSRFPGAGGNNVT